MKRIAVDLAKSVFQVAESIRAGQVVQRRRLNREAFVRYIQQQTEPVEWLMEACGTAHYWGRVMQAQGHRVRLIHARYVCAYRLRNKTDRSDCDAILEAGRRADIHAVPVKSQEQQLLQQLHGMRETWKKSRTQRINLLRGILREAGVEAPSQTRDFIREAHSLIECEALAPLRPELHLILAEINLYTQCMAESEVRIERWHAEDEIVRKLGGQRYWPADGQRSEECCRSARALRQWPSAQCLAGHDPARTQQWSSSTAGQDQRPRQHLRSYTAGSLRAFGIAGRQTLSQANPGAPDEASALGGANGRQDRSQQGDGGLGEQAGQDLLGGVVP